MDLQTWKTDPDSEIPHNPAPSFPPSFSLSPLPPAPAPSSEMISMEMPPMGHIGQPHPQSHHQPQMSPGYESNSDKKKRECMFLFVLEHGLLK